MICSMRTKLEILWGLLLFQQVLHWTLAEFNTSAKETVDYCDTEIFRAECPEGHVILIQSAQYGRMKVGRCVDKNYGYVGCNTDVMKLADRWCSGRRRCQIPIPNSGFKKESNCPKDLKPYFEASYTCVKVETATDQNCHSSSHILPSGTSGNIANIITMQTDKGSVKCPWMIQGRTGQKINITLLDFSRKADSRTNFVSEKISICHVYAVIREKKKPRGIKVCSSEERLKRVYTSTGHVLELRIMSRDKGTKEADYFIIQYEVSGCPDPTPPHHAWMKRTDDQAYIGCSGSGKTWQLICRGSQWEGEVGNCSNEAEPAFGEMVWGSVLIPFEVSLIIIVGIAVGIGVIILSIGLICIGKIKKSQREQKEPRLLYHKKPVNTVQPQYSDKKTKRSSGMSILENQANLPPPPDFLMEEDAISYKDHEYAYVFDMPPPPPTPPTPPSPLLGSAMDGDVITPPPPPMPLLHEDPDSFKNETSFDVIELFPPPPANLEMEKIASLLSRANGTIPTLFERDSSTYDDDSSTYGDGHEYFELEENGMPASPKYSMETNSWKSLQRGKRKHKVPRRSVGKKNGTM